MFNINRCKTLQFFLHNSTNFHGLQHYLKYTVGFKFPKMKFERKLSVSFIFCCTASDSIFAFSNYLLHIIADIGPFLNFLLHLQFRKELLSGFGLGLLGYTVSEFLAFCLILLQYFVIFLL